MKLFSRYNRVTILSTIAIFLLAWAAFTYLIQGIIINQIDEDLRIRQKEITSYAAQHGKLPEIVHVNDQLIHYDLSNDLNAPRKFKTLVLLDSVEKETNSFRQLTFPLKVNNTGYKIIVAKSLERADTLFRSILF